MPMVGGSRPDLRLSDSGKLTRGTGKRGMPLNFSTPPWATPVSVARSSSMRWACSTQSGAQLSLSSRWQVV